MLVLVVAALAELVKDHFQVIWQLFTHENPFVVINDTEETISGVEIDPAIVFHLVASFRCRM